MSTYYVATNGDDTNTGGEFSPFKTVAKAITMVAPGDTVYLRAGDYTEKIVANVSGLFGARIKIAGYPDETVNMDMSETSMTAAEGAVTVRAGFVTIDNLQITNPTTNGVYVATAEASTVQNITIPSYSGYGIRVSNTTPGKQNSYIQNCNILGNGDGITVSRADGGYWYIGNNKVSGTGKGISVGSADGPAHHIIVRSNEITATSSTAIDMGGGTYYADYFVVESNTVRNPQVSGQSVRFSPGLTTIGCIQRFNVIDSHHLEYYLYPPVSCKVYNNTVSNSTYFVQFTNATATAAHYQESLSGFGFYNNLFYTNSLAPFDDGASGPANYGTLGFDGNAFLFSASDDIDWGSTYTSDKDGWNSWRFTESADLNGYIFTTLPGATTYPRQNGGSYLTTIVSGSGTTWVVGDASFFSNGYGLVAGDTLKVGKKTAVINTISYASNTIEFTSSQTFTVGDPVSYNHTGFGPDVGA